MQDKQLYPDHPDRFDYHGKVLCREGLTGRCYWEVEWTVVINIGVAFKKVKRKGWESLMDWNDKTWMLNNNTSRGFSFRHGHQEVFVPIPHIDVKAFLARRRRLGLFLDWPAGILCFYWLSGNRRTLLHIFHSTFTEPVYPAFEFTCGSLTLSAVKKLEIDHVSVSDCVIEPKLQLCITKKFIHFDPLVLKVHLGFTPEVSRERIGISYR